MCSVYTGNKVYVKKNKNSSRIDLWRTRVHVLHLNDDTVQCSATQFSSTQGLVTDDDKREKTENKTKK